MNNNINSFFKKNGFYVAICSTIAVMLVASLYFSYNNFTEKEQLAKNEENLEVNKSDVKSYKETETFTEATTSLKQSEVTEAKTEITTEAITEATTIKQAENNKAETTTKTKTFSLFDESKEMLWPVSGKIVMDYSTETAIYDKTLDLYRTNDSISISTPQGTDVLASADGVVESIFVDEEKGNTVVISHGNGWISTYSQLEKDASVSVGQIVDEGEKIGIVGLPSNYSTLLGPHLEFKVTKDEVSSDPKLVLAQIAE